MIRPHTRARIMRQRRLDAQEAAGDVDAQGEVPFLVGDLVKRAHLDLGEERRVVDQDIGTAVPRDGRLDHALDRLGIGHVGLHGQGILAVLGDFAGHALAGLGIDFSDHRDGALGGEAVRIRAADALTAAGDDRHAVFQAGEGIRHRQTVPPWSLSPPP